MYNADVGFRAKRESTEQWRQACATNLFELQPYKRRNQQAQHNLVQHNAQPTRNYSVKISAGSANNNAQSGRQICGLITKANKFMREAKAAKHA